MKVEKVQQAGPGDLWHVWALQSMGLDHHCNSTVSTLTRKDVMMCNFRLSLTWLTASSSCFLACWFLRPSLSQSSCHAVELLATWMYLSWTAVSTASNVTALMNIPAQLSLQMMAAPSDTWLNDVGHTMWRLLRETSQTKELWKIIIIGFKLLSFGLVCCIAIENWDNHGYQIIDSKSLLGCCLGVAGDSLPGHPFHRNRK